MIFSAIALRLEDLLDKHTLFAKLPLWLADAVLKPMPEPAFQANITLVALVLQRIGTKIWIRSFYIR